MSQAAVLFKSSCDTSLGLDEFTKNALSPSTTNVPGTEDEDKKLINETIHNEVSQLMIADDESFRLEETCFLTHMTL